MQQTKLIMGMPITVEIIDTGAGAAAAMAETFAYFREVDERFSTYKPTSEVSRLNAGWPAANWSDDLKLVLKLCEQTKQQTGGYFDVYQDGRCDPSGLVKGWAIQQAAERLLGQGFENFRIDAGGDVQVHGHSDQGESWKIGIRNPFSPAEIVKVLAVSNEGIATSGSYLRGQHIYNPHQPDTPLQAVTSLTVVGPNIYDADRFATAAFAMGEGGIGFIESLAGFEGYMIDADRTATYTSNFESYVAPGA